MRREIVIVTGIALVAAVVIFVFAYQPAIAPTTIVQPSEQPTPRRFEGTSAMRFAQAQCDIGPRPPGSLALAKTGDYIIQNLKSFGWAVETQEFTYRSTPIRNIVAKRGQGPLVIVGAHYDTRPMADRDPLNPLAHIAGGNDGASGTAALLELARVLPARPNKEVWLAFFDAEDRGGIEGWPFSVGSEHLAASLQAKPEAVVVLDMIGDRDQQFYYEANSNPDIQKAIFAQAAALGHAQYFIPQVKFSMTDDHTPFLQRGYPAVDLIDFDYPYWHTEQDTCDKIGADSLERVGRTVQQWLLNGAR